MWKLLRTLFRPSAPPAPKLVTLLNRVDELEERIEGVATGLRKLSGRVTGSLRAKPDDEVIEDAPGPTNGTDPVSRQVELGRLLHAVRGRGNGVLPR